MNSKIVVFMPSIEGGGVEKNLFLVCNYLVKKVRNLKVITISKNFKRKFSNSIEIVTYSYNFLDKLSRRLKYLLSIFLLIKEILKNKKIIVFSNDIFIKKVQARYFIFTLNHLTATNYFKNL